MEAKIESFNNFLIIFGIILSIVAIFSIIILIAKWNLYKKAGYKGWESLIPLYNNWILIKIAELNEWYYLGLISPTLFNIINIEDITITIISSLIQLTTIFFIYYNISKKFNQDLIFAILLVIFPYIMIPILGFSKDHIYNPNIKVSKHGPINDNNHSNNNYNQNTNEYNNQFKYCNHCGNNLDNNSNFCRYCGTKINEN